MGTAAVIHVFERRGRDFNVSLDALFFVTAGGFAVALIGGWRTFVRRDVMF